MGIPYQNPQSSYAAKNHNDLECGLPLLDQHSVDDISDFNHMPTHSIVKLCPFCQFQGMTVVKREPNKCDECCNCLVCFLKVFLFILFLALIVIVIILICAASKDNNSHGRSDCDCNGPCFVFMSPSSGHNDNCDCSGCCDCCESEQRPKKVIHHCQNCQKVLGYS